MRLAGMSTMNEECARLNVRKVEFSELETVTHDHLGTWEMKQKKSKFRRC